MADSRFYRDRGITASHGWHYSILDTIHQLGRLNLEIGNINFALSCSIVAGCIVVEDGLTLTLNYLLM